MDSPDPLAALASEVLNGIPPGGLYFEVERDADGNVLSLTPVRGRVERAGDGYIVTGEPET